MADQRLERAKKKLNSESFRKLTERVNYEDLSVKQRELADVIGVEATLKLCEALGGKSVYIPGNLWFDRQEQDRRIREDFDSGMPTQQKMCIRDRGSSGSGDAGRTSEDAEAANQERRGNGAQAANAV